MKISKNQIFDKLHRGFVLTSIGVTLYAGFCISDILYDYFTRVKPQLLAKQEAAKLELLQEGSSAKLLLNDTSNELN